MENNKNMHPFSKKVRKLFKTGRGASYGIILPKEVIKFFDWQERQKLVIEIDFKEKRLLIRDWNKKDD